MRDFHEAWPSVLRGTALGSILGVLPGGGALLSSFASYTVEKKVTRNLAFEFGPATLAFSFAISFLPSLFRQEFRTSILLSPIAV